MWSDQAMSGMRDLGITDPDPESELHIMLAETFDRLGASTEDVLIPAVQWCYQADLVRWIEEYATAKTEAERTVGAGVIRYRAMGEKSAEVARMKAEAQDSGVYEARLRYRLAEQMIAADKRALDILHAQLEAWRTRRADDRKADAFMAKEGV